MRNLHHSQPQFARTALRACALAAAMLASTQVQAQESEPATWTFGGFGSFGVVHSDYAEADFTSSALKGEGAGATRSLSPVPDSRLGAQIGYRHDRKWSSVLQVGTEHRFDGTYRTEIEWGNIKYQATPDLALRVGRIALPIFLAADYRKIGYAYPWVRTPVEVYGGVPITNNDGVDVAYRWRLGGVKHTTQVFWGKTDIYLTKTTDVKARDMGGITHTAEHGATTVRLSAFKANLNVNIVRDLLDAFRLFGPQGVAIADKYDIINKRTTGFAVGLNYDPGNWFLMAEAGRMSSKTFFSTSYGGYVSSGLRTGEFTPYVGYAFTRGKQFKDEKGLSLAGLPPQFAYVGAQLNDNLGQLLATVAVQSNLSAGVRWDFRPDMALKLQYERITPRKGSRGTLRNATPAFESDRAVNVTSAVLDFVF